MTNHLRSPRAKFRVGQVVRFTLTDKDAAVYLRLEGKWPGGTWSGSDGEDYDEEYLRPLTKKEAGR